MEDENKVLTINDYIVLSDGSRRPYCAIPTQSNFVQRTEDRVRQETAEIPERISNNVHATLCHVSNEHESLRQSSNQRREQCLPPGKEFHVFFSHSSEDREWVLRMIHKLESPEFGFKCCFADRDFDLGSPVLHNVAKYINLSKKTVMVLTPQFLQSPWCRYETRVTVEMELDTKQRLLVPIMLRNCQVPEFIGRLSYIEVDNEHFWDRFLQAIKDEPCETSIEPVRSDAMIPGGPVPFNPNFTSTDIICEVVVEIGQHGLSGTNVYVMPNELKRNGMQLTAEDYRAIVGILSGNRTLIQQELPYTACYCISLVIFLCVLIPMTVSVFWIFGGLSALVPLLMVILVPVLCCVSRYCTISESTQTWRNTTAEANKIAIRHNMMVSCKAKFRWFSNESSQNSICIVFMYYEWRPCHSHLKRILQNDNGKNDHRRQLPSETTSLIMAQRRAENIETRVENLLMHHATEYGQLVLEGRTQCPREQRHTRQKECLCQFIERALKRGT